MARLEPAASPPPCRGPPTRMPPFAQGVGPAGHPAGRAGVLRLPLRHVSAARGHWPAAAGGARRGAGGAAPGRRPVQPHVRPASRLPAPGGQRGQQARRQGRAGGAARARHTARLGRRRRQPKPSASCPAGLSWKPPATAQWCRQRCNCTLMRSATACASSRHAQVRLAGRVGPPWAAPGAAAAAAPSRLPCSPCSACAHAPKPTHARTDIALEDRQAFLRELRHAHGRTGLVLSGGGSFGFWHFGVVRALLEAGLLPRVVSGSSAGSIGGSLLCTHTDEELRELVKVGGCGCGCGGPGAHGGEDVCRAGGRAPRGTPINSWASVLPPPHPSPPRPATR